MKRVKNRKTLGKHVIYLYLTVISQVVIIRNIQKLRQGIENDPEIKWLIQIDFWFELSEILYACCSHPSCCKRLNPIEMGFLGAAAHGWG